MKFDILSEYCFVNMGQSPASETYNNNADGLPFYQGNADFGEIHPQTRIWCSAPVKIANKGDLLISVRAPIGALNIATEQCCIGRGLAALTPKLDKCRIKYIYFAIQSQINFLIANGTGSTFKAVNKNTLENLLIPVSSLNKQDEIVNIFEKLNNIINKRKEQLLLMDNAVKSRFIEMFGSLGSDKFGWGLMKLGNCCEINPSKINDNRLKENLYVSFIPMSCVTDDGKITEMETKTYYEVKSGFTYFKEGDVLFAKITPCMENGKGAIAIGLYNKVGFGSTEFHVLRPIKEKCNSYWLYMVTMFSEFRLIAESNMTGSAGQKRVPVSFLENFKISVPPIELQNEFADFFKQTDKSKLEIQKSLDKLEILKKSLMQQYFG